MTDITVGSNLPQPDFGPAMRALHPRWQRAVIGLFLSGGNMSQALRYAGYKGTSLNGLKASAWKMFHDPRMKAAVLEECANRLASTAPEMLELVAGIARDTEVDPKERLAAARIYLDRGLPVTSVHRVEVEHHLSVDELDVSHYRALQKLGAQPQAFLDRFGPNGLPRVEAMVAAEATKHKQIETDYEDVTDEQG